MIKVADLNVAALGEQGSGALDDIDGLAQLGDLIGEPDGVVGVLDAGRMSVDAEDWRFSIGSGRRRSDRRRSAGHS